MTKKKNAQQKVKTTTKPAKRKATSPAQVETGEEQRNSTSACSGGVSKKRVKKLNQCMNKITDTIIKNFSPTEDSPVNLHVPSQTGLYSESQSKTMSSPGEYIQYGMQTPVSSNSLYHYQQTQQTPMTSYLQQIQAQAPPPQGPPPSGIPTWATELLDNIKELKNVLPTIDQINRTVTDIKSRMVNLEEKVKVIDHRVTEVEKSCSFVGGQFDEHTKNLNSAKSTIYSLQKQCAFLQQNVQTLNDQNAKQRNELIDLKSRSMRDNLLFYGIPEVGTTDKPENCEELVKNMCKETIDLDISEAKFKRTHRVGPNNAKKPRPIVVNFYDYQVRENVRQTALDKKDTLKENSRGIGPQRPKEVRDAMKNLYDVMKAERQKGNRTRIIGDQLYINGVLYVPPAGHQIAPGANGNASMN